MAYTAVSKDFKDFAMRSPLVLSVVSFLIVAAFVRYLLNRPKRLNLPLVGSPASNDWAKDLIEGTLQYPDTPFSMPTSPPTVILPISMFDEVRYLPEKKASFDKLVREVFAGRHTGFGVSRPEIVAAVKVDLTRNIARALDGLQDEVKYALDKEFGSCHDWTSIEVYGKLARIVALLSGRVFVGRPLSREEEWISSTTQFAAHAHLARMAIVKWTSWLRPFVAPFLPEVQRLNQHKTRGAQLLTPLLKDCLARAQDEKSGLKGYEDEQGTMISWLLKHMAPKERDDPLVLGINQMMLSFAAIFTTSMATCHAVYDLACRPEYVEPLRKEINEVLREDGYDLDGEGLLKLKKTSMSKLRKLDSFIKESQRLSPLAMISNTRVVTSDLTLSTGLVLPKGTRFGVASYAVHTSADTTTYSPSYNSPGTKSPTEFDGFRFSNLRAMKGKENKHQFVTTSPESLNFGHGNHACPGRFFASNEIKVVLIELLRNWEFRLKGDVERKGGEENRPKNGIQQLSVTPNMFAELDFKRREEVDLKL
ncbi:Cytochrome P450 monooygenase [Lachnellula occidentalis]|uniref:Cytochrome P450 monooygenase n=1 Tax=Lachnellula occidentalis TaxID=215460 RepID=A0A8H8UG82_9HELO|nr:Cytochrome P450 monooygenase [Lachnellula occidentalis]